MDEALPDPMIAQRGVLSVASSEIVGQARGRLIAVVSPTQLNKSGSGSLILKREHMIGRE